MVFQWDFADRVPESRSLPGVECRGFEAGFEKRPTLQLGMSLASGTQLHRHEARLRWDAFAVDGGFLPGFLCQITMVKCC